MKLSKRQQRAKQKQRRNRLMRNPLGAPKQEVVQILREENQKLGR
jgi:hypothetical protein